MALLLCSRILPVVFGRMLVVKEGYKRLLWLERKQEKIVDFKGGSSPEDNSEQTRHPAKWPNGRRCLAPKAFAIFILSRNTFMKS